MKWNIGKLLAIASLAGLTAVLMLAGAGLATVTGVFAASAPVALIVQPFMFVLTVLIVREFGGGTIMGIIFGLLVVPLPVVGTPGFFPKIIITGLMGLGVDIAFFSLKKRELLASLVSGGVNQVIIGAVLFGAANAFGFPGLENLPAFLSTPIGFFLGLCLTFVIGMFGAYLGWITYNRIKNSQAVARVQQ